MFSATPWTSWPIEYHPASLRSPSLSGVRGPGTFEITTFQKGSSPPPFISFTRSTIFGTAGGSRFMSAAMFASRVASKYAFIVSASRLQARSRSTGSAISGCSSVWQTVEKLPSRVRSASGTSENGTVATMGALGAVPSCSIISSRTAPEVTAMNTSLIVTPHAFASARILGSENEWIAKLRWGDSRFAKGAGYFESPVTGGSVRPLLRHSSRILRPARVPRTAPGRFAANTPGRSRRPSQSSRPLLGSGAGCQAAGDGSSSDSGRVFQKLSSMRRMPTPSVSAWCMNSTTATRPPSSPSTTHTCQSGRV